MKSPYFIKPVLLFIIHIAFAISVKAQQDSLGRYYVESEKQIEVKEPGSHNGGGNTTAYKFFKSVPGSKLQLTKRILEPGAAIGYHLQKQEEIYYIISGTGEMMMNEKKFPVKEGDAVMTMPGNSHGLKQTGTVPLIVIINYQKK